MFTAAQATLCAPEQPRHSFRQRKLYAGARGDVEHRVQILDLIDDAPAHLEAVPVHPLAVQFQDRLPHLYRISSAGLRQAQTLGHRH